jgi:methylglutaconyl-CoA hydratase
MESYKTIYVDIQDSVASVWLNRPDVQNAINAEMLDELQHCFSSLENLEDIRIIVLRGKGKSFCAGADLKRMLKMNSLSYEENLGDGYRWAECLSTIHNSVKPTIAVATGNIFGGGNGLLCAADLVIAETNAKFSFSEVKLGLAPSTILPYVLTRLNEHKAKYLMFTGKSINADEAHVFNLVDFVAPIEELEVMLNSLIINILKASPSGIKEIKYLIGELKNNLPEENLNRLTANSIAKLKVSDEAFEGISAFLDKRLPSWSREK